MDARLKNGVTAASPIVMGYLPIGFAYGVLAMEVGLNLFELILMSLLVYAGSSQFIAVGMIGAGVNPLGIIITTFLVNLRHLLMSASLAPHFKYFSKKLLPILSFGITDETFAVNSTKIKNAQPNQEFVLGLHFTSHISWILSGLIGGVFHQAISDTEALGLDFVLYAMFIFLLIMQIESKLELIVAAIAGMISLALANLFPDVNWHIILATIVGATIGVLISWKWKSY